MLQSSYVDVDGVRLHMVSGGHGRPVLFLHGIPEFWYAWKAQLSALAKTHRVIALDLPGCNLSAPLPSAADYALEPVAGLIARFIRQVAPGERVALVGHDVGGIIAWELASQHEDIVDRIVVINAPPAAVIARQLARDPEQQRASAYIRLLRQPGWEATLRARDFEQLAARVFDSARSPEVFSPDDRRAYLASWSRPGSLEGALAYYRAFDGGAAARAPVRAPTLVLWGERDPFLLPGCLDEIEAMGREVEVRRLPDATHWVVHEEPALVNAELRAFLSPAAPRLRFERVALDLVALREKWRQHPDYGCFWSSPDNPRGLRLTPHVEPGRVWLRMRIERDHSGIIGIAHGGIPFSVLDGMMGWLIMSNLGRAGVTTEASVRYLAPLRVGHEYELEATPEPGEPPTERRVALRARAFPVGRPDQASVEVRAQFALIRRGPAEALLERRLHESELPLFPE